MHCVALVSAVVLLSVVSSGSAGEFCQNVTVDYVDGKAVGVVCCPRQTVFWVGGVNTTVSEGAVFPCVSLPHERNILKTAESVGLTIAVWGLIGYGVVASAIALYVVFFSARGRAARALRRAPVPSPRTVPAVTDVYLAPVQHSNYAEVRDSTIVSVVASPDCSLKSSEVDLLLCNGALGPKVDAILQRGACFTPAHIEAGGGASVAALVARGGNCGLSRHLPPPSVGC